MSDKISITTFTPRKGVFQMSQPTEYQRVESAVRYFVGKPLAIIVYGAWVSGRFIIRKAVDYAARLRNTTGTAEAKPAR